MSEEYAKRDFVLFVAWGLIIWIIIASIGDCGVIKRLEKVEQRLERSEKKP